VLQKKAKHKKNELLKSRIRGRGAISDGAIPDNRLIALI
jgi:hypothetical protein